MKIHYVLTRRGRSLIAGAGIAAAIAFNGLSGGSASAAELQPAPTGCVTLPAGQGQTQVVPDAGTGGTSTAPDTGDAGSFTTAQGQQAASGECFTQSAETTSPTISVQVCVSPDGTVVQSIPATGSAPADPAAAGQPQGGTASFGTAGGENTASNGAVTSGGELTVSQGTVLNQGIASTAATCVSISITNGQPTIVSPAVPSATLQPAPTTPSAGEGAPATGETVPAQPGAGSGTQVMPDTTPQPGQ